MSRSILKKSGPMRVPRDDLQVDTKDEVKEREEGQSEASVSVPDTSGEDRKDGHKKPFKNKNLKAKDSMRLSSTRLSSSPRSRFLQKRKESSSSPRLLKIKEGEHTFTYPESVRGDAANISGDAQEKVLVKDTSHGTLKQDTVDIAQSNDSVHRTSGKVDEHKTCKVNIVGRAPGEYLVHRTSGKDPEHKTSKEDTEDRKSGTDTDHKTSKQDTVVKEPGRDPEHIKSSKGVEHTMSMETIVDITTAKDPVDRTSGKDAEHKTSKEDTVDKAFGENPVHRTSGENAEHKTSTQETLDRETHKDPFNRTSDKDAEHKMWNKNTANRTCRSDDSGHVYAPTDVEDNEQTVPDRHTTSVAKSPNRTQIEQQEVVVASAGEGSVPEVLVRDDVVAEDKDTSSCGHVTGGSHEKTDNPDGIVSDPDNSSHVESETFSKRTMEVQALLNECPSPNDEIDDNVLPTHNPSPEHTVELQDRPAVGLRSRCDGEENLSIVGHKAKNIVGVQALTMVDIHPNVTFLGHAGYAEDDGVADVPFSGETVGVPVVPAADQIPPNSEKGLPALEPFQEDVNLKDMSFSDDECFV
ncbi:uncharacterized protein [Haliotis asinina]|uniref:uncharacterized protein isoform X2 n=1 Tax=Haliotis asinina TaxID=109174 RepID=UPI00353219DF